MQKKRREKKERTLPQSLIVAYSLIILVPIIILVAVTALLLQMSISDGIMEEERVLLESKADRIEGVVSSFVRLETIVNLRTDLLRYLAHDADQLDSEDIEDYIRMVLEVERNLFLVNDQVENVHLFIDNPKVYERFPVVVSISRMEDVLQPWDYGTRSPVLLRQNAAENPEIAVYTKELRNLGRKIGYIQMSTKLSTIFPELFSLENEKQNTFYFHKDFNGNYKRILSVDSGIGIESDAVSESIILQALSQIDSLSTQGEIRQGFNRFLYRTFPSMNLVLIQAAPSSQLGMIWVLFMLGGTLIAILILTAVIAFAYRSTKKNTEGLGLIMEAMVEVSKGNFDVKAPEKISSIGEVRKASAAFEEMTAQLRNSIDEIKQKEKLLSDTRINAMQNQINVHFIFNAIESIKMQALLHGDEEIEETTALLGNMLRYCLKWKVNIVHLQQELEYIHDYIQMMNFRNDFTVTIEDNISPDLYDLNIPKMILQPIIENEFRHNFEEIGQDGVIIMKSSRGEDRFYLDIISPESSFKQDAIEATLAYLKEDVPERNQKSGGIGLKNIQDRLYMYYGSSFTIEITKDDTGCVTIRVPLKNIEEES